MNRNENFIKIMLFSNIGPRKCKKQDILFEFF